MAAVRHCLLLFCLLACCTFYPQQSPSLEAAIKKMAASNSDKPDFYKAQTYFLQKNWDSTLVYSMRQLVMEHNRDVADYCHFFRAHSFKNKKLLPEAVKEFRMVSPGFPFIYKVKLYLGEIMLMEGNHTTALHHFMEAEKLVGKKGYDFKRGVLYHNIGLCYIHIDQYGKAKQYLDRSFEILQKEKDTVSLIGAYMSIGNLYYEQYKDGLAIPYFTKAYLLSKKTKDLESKQNTALNMAVVAENNHNSAAALAYRKEYETWKDSLGVQNKVWDIADLEKKFAVKGKEKEIHILEAENKLKIAERNRFIYVSVLFLLLFMTVAYFYRKQVRSNRIILLQKQQLDVLNEAKDRLFSIVSHDLRSSVSALKKSNTLLLDHLERKNFTEFDQLLHQNIDIANGTYNLLDNLLHWALLQTRQLYFRQEDLHLHSVAAQTALDYKPFMAEKGISFENNVSKAVFVYADQGSLKIILRNLMDNAIKFTAAGGKITISSTETDPGFCDFSMQDSGCGMSKTSCAVLMEEDSLPAGSGRTGTGLGLQLCRSMAAKNGGKLLIESEEGTGTKMTVRLLKAKKDE